MGLLRHATTFRRGWGTPQYWRSHLVLIPIILVPMPVLISGCVLTFAITLYLGFGHEPKFGLVVHAFTYPT